MSDPPPLFEWHDGVRVLARADRVDEAVNKVLYGRVETLVKCGVPIVTYCRNTAIVNIWKEIVDRFSIPGRDTLFKRCLRRADTLKKNNFDVRSLFIETIAIDQNEPYHEYLTQRASKETLTYGSMPLYRWFAIAAAICEEEKRPYPIELKYIAGIISKSEQPPFKVKQKDFSVLSSTQHFYNIANIIECQLNIFELRYMQQKTTIKINEQPIDIGLCLDQLALMVGESPKIMVQEAKSYFSFVVHMAASYGSNPTFVEHVGASPAHNHFSTTLNIREANKKHLKAFGQCKQYLDIRRKGESFLIENGATEINKLCALVLEAELAPANLSHDLNRLKDFVLGCTFIMSMLRVAGFGRASKFIAAPRSAPEPVNPNQYEEVADMFKKLIIDSHHAALKAGFNPVTESNFIGEGMAMWKTTSSGTKPIEINITVNDRPYTVKGKSKNLYGSATGVSTFERAMIGTRNTSRQPYKTGVRDVPYKQRRLIFAVPLYTLHAQVAVASHMVKYISTNPRTRAFSGDAFSSGFVVTGSGDTTGVRIDDNKDVLMTSGIPTMLAFDADLSEYDSRCVWANFRKPMIDALNVLDQGAVFGPDKIPYLEMVQYAFGSGFMHNTWWDIGRKPVITLRTGLNEETQRMLITKYSLTQLEVDEKNPNLLNQDGLKALSPGVHYEYVYHPDTLQISKEDLKYFYYSSVLDGSDLMLLSSEGSGELTTLLFNSLMNLAIQEYMWQRAQRTSLGRKLKRLRHRAIGDDITVQFTIEDDDITTPEIEEFINTCTEAVAACGHKMNPYKTFFMILKSEYVQTFAVKGVYVPKDQLMVIPSEKPREIDDPLSFCDGLRRIMLTKLARGASHDPCVMLTALQYSYITRKPMHSTKFLFVGESFIDVGRRRILPVDVKIEARDYKMQSFERKLDYSDTGDVYQAPSLSMLPHSAGGIGLCDFALPVILFDTLVLTILDRFKPVSARRYLTLYQYFKTRSTVQDSTRKEDIRVSDIQTGGAEFLPIQFLFSKTHIEGAERALRAGLRMNGLSLFDFPKTMIRKALQYEKSLRSNRMAGLEHAYREVLLSLSKPIHGSGRGKPIVDEYMLKASCEYGPSVHRVRPTNNNFDSLSSFVFHLDDKVAVLMHAYGIIEPGKMHLSKTLRLRMIISRDPILRSTHTPESVSRLFRSHGVETEEQRPVGLALLEACGFSADVASDLFAEYAKGEAFIVDSVFHGCGTDDVCNMVNLVVPEDYHHMTMPPGIPNTFRYNMYMFFRMKNMVDVLFNGEVLTPRNINFTKKANPHLLSLLDEFSITITRTPRLKAYQSAISENYDPDQLFRLAVLDEEDQRAISNPS